MSVLSSQADELREAARQFDGYQNGEISRMLREAADTIESLRDRLQESCGQVPEQAKRGNSGEHESCGEACGDDRFELIGKAKAKLLEATNIESRPEEVAMLDSILFRCWQMGWLDKLRDDDSRYSELFGTPERAAKTAWRLLMCHITTRCGECPMREGCNISTDADCDDGVAALLEWLKQEVDA